MHITFNLTKLGGGVFIKGDEQSLLKVERLLVKTANESHNSYSDGACMMLTPYFEKKRRRPVDWITLVAGVAALRNSNGYVLSRENHALICLLEYELSNALSKALGSDKEDKIESVLYSLSCFSDHIGGEKVESRVVYLYLLKTPEARKAELLSIIMSLSPFLVRLDGLSVKKFEGLNHSSLYYDAGKEFQYEL